MSFIPDSILHVVQTRIASSNNDDGFQTINSSVRESFYNRPGQVVGVTSSHRHQDSRADGRNLSFPVFPTREFAPQ